MNLASKKYLIFDFDETISKIIIDWRVWQHGIVDIVAEYLPGEDFNHDGHIFSRQNDFIDQFGQEINRKFIVLAEQFERDLLETHEPDAKVVAFIKNNSNYHFYIWTSNHSSTVEPILRELGVLSKIKKIVGRDDVAFIKPRADGFQQIFVPGSQKTDYLMIGDSSYDEEAAKTAQIDFLHVNDFKQLID
jgi:HAD superfamily hydrolase (TIGR01549 family)